MRSAQRWRSSAPCSVMASRAVGAAQPARSAQKRKVSSAERSPAWISPRRTVPSTWPRNGTAGSSVPLTASHGKGRGDLQLRASASGIVDSRLAAARSASPASQAKRMVMKPPWAEPTMNTADGSPWSCAMTSAITALRKRTSSMVDAGPPPIGVRTSFQWRSSASGATTRKPSRAPSVGRLVSRQMSSADCVPPCSSTTTGRRPAPRAPGAGCTR